MNSSLLLLFNEIGEQDLTAGSDKFAVIKWV